MTVVDKIKHPPRLARAIVGVSFVLASLVLVVLSTDVARGTSVVFDGAAALLGLLAALLSQSISAIVSDTLRRPTVHTQIVRVGDNYVARLFEDDGTALGHGAPH